MTKNRFLLAFVAVVALLALVRWTVMPDVMSEGTDNQCGQISLSDSLTSQDSRLTSHLSPLTTKKYHPIRSVHSYKAAFPDSQAVQIVAAQRWGVKPVANRADAEARKRELVYVECSPYYHVDPLHSSIPYLVPRAATLLQDIGQAFYDSLYLKGVPMQQLIVTSVLRSMEDVRRLQRHNGNATDNSCHLYGTTFDICYNRYQPIERPVRNDTLKWVLSEVLRDMREQGRCYIKYEVKQGCFHMTVR